MTNTSEKRLRIDQPDFRASEYVFDPIRKHWYCQCEELIEGHWEGFVSVTKTNPIEKKFKTNKND